MRVSFATHRAWSRNVKLTPTASKTRCGWRAGKAGERGRGGTANTRGGTLASSARGDSRLEQAATYRKGNGDRGSTAGRTSDPGPSSERARNSAAGGFAEPCARISRRRRLHRQRNDMGAPNDGKTQRPLLLLFDGLR